MFAQGSDQEVSIGVVSKPILGRNTNPGKSFIGGSPVWHNCDTAPTNKTCQVCNSSKYIVLVGQLYAPVEGIERSLYIFTCLKKQCHKDPASWFVIRNQKTEKVISYSKRDDSMKDESITSAVDPVMKQAAIPSNWSSLLGDACKDSSTTLATNTDHDDIDDLMAMLEQRDASLQPPTAVRPTTTTQPAPEKKKEGNKNGKKKLVLPTWSLASPVLPSSLQLPCLLLEIFPEDTSSSSTSASHSQGKHTKNKLAAEKMHIQQLLTSYLRDVQGGEGQEREEGVDAEELQAVQTALHQLNLATTDFLEEEAEDEEEEEDEEDTGDGGEEVDEEEEVRRSAAVAMSSSSHKKMKDKNSKGKNKAATSSAPSKRRDQQLTQRFLQRLSYHPQQVIRYAYGGQPLWIRSSSNSGRHSQQDIPCCPYCQTSRQFECQLMSPLIDIFNQHQPSEKKKGGAQDGEEEEMVEELDFGTVEVWSCPYSCEPVDKSVTAAALADITVEDKGLSTLLYEHVVVQPALDSL